MLGKILPVLMLAVGAGAGIGAGLYLKPDPSEMTMEEHDKKIEHKDGGTKSDDAAKKMDAGKDDDATESTYEYVKLNNQFLVPVVVDELIESLVVMTLSVEVETGRGEVIYSREPKLRDAFLQVLFDHSNIGGFRGEFTNAKNLDALRQALTEVAQSIAGDSVNGILITDIARQDV